MQHLRRRVIEHDVHRWADRFTEDLRTAAAAQSPSAHATGVELTRVIDRLRDGPLTVLLDYDGTLVPIAKAPQLAAPDAELLSLLSTLAARPRTEVHLVSGRPHETFERWFGQLPVTLWAEHGFWHRPAPHGEWDAAAPVPSEWLKRVYPILEQFTATTPGSLIEEKSASIAWHYRMAEPEFGPRQAHELRMLLGDALSNQPLEVLEGKKVIEIRLRGVSKALVSQRVLASHDPQAAVLAIGDDRTDEDLFGALPESAVTIAVGTGRTQAKYFVEDHLAVRRLLRRLLSHATA
jgi:trehalose 6-phosphate synthase/phosphatase